MSEETTVKIWLDANIQPVEEGSPYAAHVVHVPVSLAVVVPGTSEKHPEEIGTALGLAQALEESEEADGEGKESGPKALKSK